MLKRVEQQPDGQERRPLRLPFTGRGGEALGVPTVGSAERSGQRFRRRLLAYSFMLLVAFPTVVTALYYTFLAADQYSAEARFAIRGASAANVPDLLGVFGGQAGPGATDAYFVIDFLRSRQVLDKLMPEVDYRQIYNHKSADFFARLDPQLPMEDTVRYWRQMVAITLDNTSGIMTLRVRAFTPEDARRLAAAILDRSEHLINDLSERARVDAVKAADQEVSRMEARLRASRLALQDFRETRKELDPRRKAESRQQIIETLQGELARARTRLAGLRQQLADTAPSIVYQLAIIRALEKQIEDERGRYSDTGPSTDGVSGSIGGLITDFEALAVEREFAEKAYLSALASLERARFDAVRQQRYLATIVSPSLPDDAQYPKRILNTLLVFAMSFCLWGLLSLISLAVRDHIS